MTAALDVFFFRRINNNRIINIGLKCADCTFTETHQPFFLKEDPTI